MASGDHFHPYMGSEPLSIPNTTQAFSTVAQELFGLSWGNDVVAPIPGVQNNAVLREPKLKQALRPSQPMEWIFDEPLDSPRNLYELHRDRRYKQDETTLWVRTKRQTVKRPKFKQTLTIPAVEQFWALSTLILDLGQEHISAAYCTGEFWRSTDAEAVRILAESAKFTPFRQIWDNYSVDDFVAWMAGSMSIDANSAPKWKYTKEDVLEHVIASYFAKNLSRFLKLGQERMLRIAYEVTIKAVATKETCGVRPDDIDDPLTTLAGASSNHAKLVLDSLVPLSSDAGETQDQLRVRLHKSQSSLSVTHALVNELGPYPIAHGLKRLSSDLNAQGPPDIPYAIFAFGSAMVETRLKVLRDLPMMNNQVFGAADDDKNLSLETISLWGSHKDSIASVVEAAAADGTASDSTDEALSSPLSSSRNIFTSLGVQARATAAKAAFATAAMKDLKTAMAMLTKLVCLPAIDSSEKVQERAITNIMTSVSPAV